MRSVLVIALPPVPPNVVVTTTPSGSVTPLGTPRRL
jgi:hypothetical protein